MDVNAVNCTVIDSLRSRGHFSIITYFVSFHTVEAGENIFVPIPSRMP